MRIRETLGVFAGLVLLAAACNSSGQEAAEQMTTPTVVARQTVVTQQPSPVPSDVSLPSESCEMVEAGTLPPGIHVIDPETCEVAQVTDGRSDGHLAWSPDGKQLAFGRLETPSAEGGNVDLFVVNSDGSDLRQLTDTEGEHESAPAWSPDGSTIAFAAMWLGQIERTQWEGLNEEEWTYDLKVLELANPRNVKTLVVDLGRLDYDWSPDSRHLAVLASRERTLFVVDVASGEVRDLAADAVPWFGHEWSPDGMRITYRCGKEEAAEHQRDVCVISRDGGNRVVLARERYFDRGPGGSSEIGVAAGASPSWTPDGRHVAFAGAGWKLYFVDPEDGSLDRTVDDWRGEFKITWLSEGAASAHICTGEAVPCSWETIVVDLVTSEWRSLLRESCFYSSRWSPDGRLLAFAVHHGVGCL